MARQCKKNKQGLRKTMIAETGSGGRPPENDNPRIGSVNTLGSGNGTATQCVRMRADISGGRNYYYW